MYDGERKLDVGSGGNVISFLLYQHTHFITTE